MRLRPIRSTTKVIRKRMPVKLKASISRAASRRRFAEMEDVEEEEDDAYYETSEPNMKLSHAFIIVLLLHLIAVGGIFGFSAMKNRQQTLAKIAAESGLTPALPASAHSRNKVAGNSTVVESAALANSSAPAASSSAASSSAASSSAGAPPASSPVAPSGVMHEVAPGDTLTRIASKYETTIEAIVKANQLSDTAILRVGQKLIIPGKEGVATTAAGAAAAPSTSAKAAPSADQNSTTAAKSSAASASAAASAPAAKPAQQTARSTASSSGEGVGMYEVVAGDNPYKIAKKFKVSYQELLEVNGITDPTKLQIGQKLKIPKGN